MRALDSAAGKVGAYADQGTVRVAQTKVREKYCKIKHLPSSTRQSMQTDAL